MNSNPQNPSRRDTMRARAVSHLKGPDAGIPALANLSDALRVLYELASAPATATDALALLHELQVHQVEFEMQDEELRRSRVELEASLNSKGPLYDYAPVGLLSVDSRMVLRELNRTGATILGLHRDLLIGRSLADFLTSDDIPALRTMLGRVGDGAESATADLHLRALPGEETRLVHASSCLNPSGEGFLIGLMGKSAAPAA